MQGCITDVQNNKKKQSENVSTCVYVGLSEEQGETLYSIKGVKMMNTLMEAVHAILMLDKKKQQTNKQTP